MLSIALSMIVNLITISVVTGFQHEVRDKVTGFGAHLTIQRVGDFSVFEAEPIHSKQAFVKELRANNQISGAYPVGYKPILLQSEVHKSVRNPDGTTTEQSRKQIHGALLKGVDNTYNFSFFSKHLKQGRLPSLRSAEKSSEVILSRQIAQDLQLKLNDTIHGFFVKDQPVKRLFKLVGIYETGLEEFDRKIVVGDIQQVQELSDWGLKANIEVADTLYNGQLIIRSVISGRKEGFIRYDWGNGPEEYSGISICPTRDTLIRLIVYQENRQRVTESDTAFIRIKVTGDMNSPCVFTQNSSGEIEKIYAQGDENRFQIDAGKKRLNFEIQNGKGRAASFVGAFEINVKNWEDLKEIQTSLKKRFELIPNEHNESLQVLSIVDAQKDIFVWLSFLDVNVIIILTLMFIIGIINMGSALLVLILVRTSFIGVLKSLGASNWSIQKIFLYQVGQLIWKGMLIGNCVGILVCTIQYFFKPFSLNPEVYYLDSVPVEFTWVSWFLLNISTLVICLTALLLPSILITRIQPAKAVRFN